MAGTRQWIDEEGLRSPTHLPFKTRALIPLLVSLAFAQPSAAQQVGRPETEILTGTVKSDSGAPIPGADVVAIRAPDRASFSTKTDALGQYRLEIPNGTGDYLVHVTATGRVAIRKRVTRTGADSDLRLDVVVRSVAPVALATVEVRARPRSISRDETGEHDAGAATEAPPGLYGIVPPGYEGDIAALAATIPGVVPLAGGGFSVLGLDASQNSTTLNGMSLNASDIPRDASKTTTLSTTAYDPARGWFSGGQVAVSVQPGGPFAFRRSHITIDPPSLQTRDRYAQVDGGRFTNVQLSTGGDGPLTRDDRFVYSYGLQGSARSEPVTSFSAPAADVARFTGISIDSVNALREALAEIGIPLGDRSSRRKAHNFSFVGRIDHAPYDWKTFRPSSRVFGVLAYAKLAESGAIGVGPTTTAAYGGTSAHAIGMVQVHYSSFDTTGRLTDFRSALTRSRSRLSPYHSLPSGSVLVDDVDSSGGGIAGLFHFGSDQRLATRARGFTWETSGDRQSLRGRRQQHLVKLSANLRLDGSESRTEDLLGEFSFASLDDLRRNTPAAFTRATAAAATSGTVANAFVALGDSWRVTDKLNVVYGARVDGNKFLQSPRRLSDVEDVFNIDTSHLPRGLSLSPRLGFTWLRRRSGAGIRVSPVGLFAIGPSSYLRGGIGRFRSFVSPSPARGSGILTPIGSEIARLNCTGPSAPAPDWLNYLDDVTRIPIACVDGNPSAFSSVTRDVAFLHPAFRPPSSWRANLAYASRWSKLAFALEGIYSLNVDQLSRVDLNLVGTPAFLLPDEAGRPVFAALGAIDPRTGLLAPGGSRQTETFGRVDVLRADAQSRTSQLRVRVSPYLETLGNWYASLAYTLSDTRQLQRGYITSTFGSPAVREWSRGDFNSRHQIMLHGGVGNPHFAVTFFGTLMSGLPFTPLVDSDINGDGSRNDRAFIFDPATATEPRISEGIRTLLEGASPRVRRCLMRQVNRAASHNSCTGPWSASLNAQVSASGKAFRLGKRVNVTLGLINPLGGLDQLLHGSDDLRGWGSRAIPDPILLHVRGFNPSTRGFQYEVNNDFGSTRRISTAMRVPFRVTLDISVDLSTPVPVQQIHKWLTPGRAGRPGPRLTVDDIRRRYARSVRDPYSEILAQSDSLLLSPVQIDSLVAAQLRYKTDMNIVWTELATRLAGLGDYFDAADALRHAEAATDLVWELTRADIQQSLPRILNPVQLRLMPVAALFNSRGPIRGRTYGYE